MMTRVLSIILFLFVILVSNGATRTISNAGGNYNSTSTWVEGAVPTSADDVVATATSGQLTVNVASSAKTLDLTNYTDTLTMNANLSVSGAITLVSGMTYSGNSNLICLVTSTLTSNGVTVSGGLQLNGTSQTYTLADNWTVTGLVTCAGTTATTINGNTLTCNGGFTQTTVATVSGTTNFVLGGGTWTSTTSSNVLRNNVSFAGNVTLATNVAYNTGTITYTSGTITTTGSTLFCALGTTFNCSAIAWNNVTFGGTSQTFTLSADLDINGLFTCNGTTATTINGAYNLKLAGGYTQTTVLLVSGTATFLFDGAGTWTGGSTLVLRNNLTINTSDTLSIGTNVAYNTGTFTLTAGAVNTTGSTLTVWATTNFSTGIDLITWNNVSVAGTCTLGSGLDLTGTLTMAGVTFSGAYNITCANLSISAGGYTQTLTGNVTVSGTTSVTSNANTVNGAFIIYTSSLTTITSNFTGLSGTVAITLTGGGTWSGSGGIMVPITFAGNTTISGTVVGSSLTYSSGTITTTGSTVIIKGTATLSTAGITWANFVINTSNSTTTLTSDMDVNGVLYLGASGSPVYLIINGYTIYCSSLDWGYSNGGKIYGTTKIVMDGTGTLAGNSVGNTYGLWLDLTFNTSGTITASGPLYYGNGTITHTSGTMVMTGSTLYTSSTIPSLNTSGMTWYNVNTSGTAAITLLSDCNISGTAYLGNGGGSYNGAFTYRCSGNLTINNIANYPVSGTSSWLMNGTGTISANATGLFSSVLTINTTGTITFANYFNLVNANFTYTAGTIVAIGSTFQTLTTPSTININGSGFSMGKYVSSVSQAFGGTDGFSMDTFTCTTAGRTFTFAAGKTYSISSGITIVGTAASPCVFVSSSSGTQATVTIGTTAIEDIAFGSATDINSSLGQRVWTYKGTLTNATNWRQVPTEPRTAAYTF